jgi:predicted porin
MRRLLAALMLVAPTAVLAQSELSLEVNAFGGINFVKASDEIGSDSESGFDTGVRVVVSHVQGLFAYGEYTYGEVDERVDDLKVTLELDEFRVGGGYLAALSDRFSFGGYAGYVNEKLTAQVAGESASGDADGFNAGVMLQYQATPTIQTYGRFGYLNLEAEGGGPNADGPDLNVGASFELAKGFSTYVEYRYTNLQSSGAELDYSSVRGGIRLSY